MLPNLYFDLVDWYRLVDPPQDHEDEASYYQAAFERAISGPLQTLLELGAGAGNNAFYLKRSVRCTLTDASEPMLGLSRAQNPECEHVVGDMRTLRLDRTFDVVLVHDAVMYITSEDDLSAVARTAFAHTRAGGAAIFAPDILRETFCESTGVLSGEDGQRTMRCLEWRWDPDPADDTFVVDYAFLLRDGKDMKAVHDRHVQGLFSRTTWHRVLGAAGYQVATIVRPLGDGSSDEIFLCRKG